MSSSANNLPVQNYGRSPLLRYTIWLAVISASTVLMWPGLLRNLFSTNFLPHGVCMMWEPRLLWLHVVSDTLIGLSYLAISLTLGYLVQQARRSIPFHWIFLAFGLFIVACGSTHLMEVITLWRPYYWLSGDIKLITAIASVATAIILPPLVPKTIALINAAKIAREQKSKLDAANRVTVQYAVARILAQCGSIEDAAPRILGEVCQRLDWNCGEVWLVDKENQVLRNIRFWCSPGADMPNFESVTRKSVFARGVGLPGRVWDTKAPCWVADLGAEEFPRASIARKDGLQSAFGFPIVLNEEVFGVSCFFSKLPQHPDTELLATMGGIGFQIGQFIERKRAEHSNLMLAAIVENSDDAILSKDLNGIITSWNAAAERIYGYTSSEAIGQPIWMLEPADRRGETRMLLDRIRQGIGIEHFHTLRVTKDGRVINVALTISPIKNATGEINGASIIARDVTELKRAEDALRNSEKLATVGRLAATIAHEINNPLEAVTNVMYLLQSHPGLDGSGRQYVTMAEQEVSRIAHIVKQTLGFYREATEPVAVDLENVLDNILELYDRKIRTAGIEVERRYAGAQKIAVFPGEIRQVFSNLIVNAIEATPAGGKLKIHVFPSRDWTNPRVHGVRVVIADTGVGISPEDRKKLFEPFFTTKGERGTGLGLWVSHGIVVKHGGSMHVYSSVTPGRSGSCFSVFLPSGALNGVEVE